MAQLVDGAVLVWLPHFALLLPLVVNGFTVLWLVVALVNIAQLAGEGWRWWRGQGRGDDDWRRRRDDGSMPPTLTPSDDQRLSMPASSRHAGSLH